MKTNLLKTIPTRWGLVGLLFLLSACSSDSKETPDPVDTSDPTDASDTEDSESNTDAGDTDTDTDTDGGSDTTEPNDVTVTIDPETLTFEAPDMSQILGVTVEGASSGAVQWESADPYIATVNSLGMVVGVSGGTTTITATSVADSTAFASCEVTILEPEREIADEYTDPTSITEGAVNIIMCGDSTMRTYAAADNDQTGWGQVLADFLNADATVNNDISEGGRSSRSFYNEEGKWDEVKSLLEAATDPTFVFIQFGHNDQKKITDTNGGDFLTFARATQNGSTAGTYYDYLERYIVEARERGGIPILFTPFVRAYLEEGEITIKGQHNITEIYPGETAARGDYPAAMKEVAEKHDVPVIDLTAAGKAFVEEYSALDKLDLIYISGDQTHERNLGALLLAEAAVEGLAAAGILSNYIEMPDARLMMDSNSLSFGSLYLDDSKDSSFKLSAYKDVTGTIEITAPDGYTVSEDETAFESTLSIECDDTWVGTTVFVRFSPTEVTTYNADLTVTHTAVPPDYGNTAANDTPGTVTLTGLGKEAVDGEPALAAWPLVDADAGEYSADVTVSGAVTATAASLVGLVVKDISNGARLTTEDGTWPAEGSRNEARYIEFSVPVETGTFYLDEAAMSIGSGGGSKMNWDIVYSTVDDFSEPVLLEKTGDGTAKDVLDNVSYPSIGLPVEAGTTLYLRVYPYNPTAATGKYLLLRDVSISGVTN